MPFDVAAMRAAWKLSGRRLYHGMVAGIFSLFISCPPPDAAADMSVPAKALQVPGIKGADNRVRVDISAYPWRMIGRLNRNGSHCTAILVGPSTILTAAHCFWDKRRNQWSVPSAFHFVVGYEKGAVKAHSKINGFTLSDGRPPSDSLQKPPVEEDWALASLDWPLGDQFGYAPLAQFGSSRLQQKLSKGTTVVQAGYSRDIAHILTADEDCKISGVSRSKKGLLLLHQCDATQGDSGSPLFIYKSGEYELLGIHVATLTRKSGASEGVAVSVDMFGDQVRQRRK